MAETKEDNLGFKSVLHGHREASKSGRRAIYKINSAEPNPIARVEHTKIRGREACEQDFKRDASSYIWKEYKREGTQARGVLLDSNVLFWFPSANDLTSEEINKIARERHADAQIVATFRFGETPLMGGSKPEVVLRSRAKAFDTFLDPLVNYFGKSLGWEEGVDITLFKGGEKKHSIHESLNAYLASH